MCLSRCSTYVAEKVDWNTAGMEQGKAALERKKRRSFKLNLVSALERLFPNRGVI